MHSLALRLLSASIPVIAILVAAAFILPADFPWLPRQLLLAAIGIGGIALAETAMFRTPAAELPRRLGFVAPNTRMVVACLAASLPMWLFLPVASAVTGTPLHVAPDWPLLVFGVVLVNGFAEEVIHRAFFFGRLREHTSFIKAASLSALLFGAQHLYLLATLGLAGGLASIALALLLAYPLSHAFKIGGRSIVGPAILHTSSNAAFLVFGASGNGPLLLVHILVVLISIYTVFFVRRPAAARLPESWQAIIT
jgi:membrane protease YdiL (CAAX protease family)